MHGQYSTTLLWPRSSHHQNLSFLLIFWAFTHSRLATFCLQLKFVLFQLTVYSTAAAWPVRFVAHTFSTSLRTPLPCHSLSIVSKKRVGMHPHTTCTWTAPCFPSRTSHPMVTERVAFLHTACKRYGYSFSRIITGHAQKVDWPSRHIGCRRGKPSMQDDALSGRWSHYNSAGHQWTGRVV